MGGDERTPAFRKDGQDEAHLERLNRLLAPVEEDLRPADAPDLPVTFIVGPPRSGTTLLYQVLAATGAFTYVTNFAARFWMAPALALRIEQALDLHGGGSLDFESDVGRTGGWAGPHEFGYFWDRWFAPEETHHLQDRTLERVDAGSLARELAAMERVDGRPLLFKNVRVGFHASFLDRVLEDAVFVLCRRDPLYTMQSILQTRQRVLGDAQAWWSIRPAAYPDLKDLPAEEQIAGQVHHTLTEMRAELDRLEEDQWTGVTYEALCEDPTGTVEQVAEIVEGSGASLDLDLDTIPERFECRNEVKVEAATFDRLRRAADKEFGEGASDD